MARGEGLAVPETGRRRVSVVDRGRRSRNPLLPWLTAYMALFLLRPWEELVPALAVVPLEKIAGIAVILRVLLGRERRISLPWPLRGLLAFAASLVLATLLSVEPYRSWLVVEQFLKAVLFSLCVAWGLRDGRDLAAWLRAWVLILGLYQAKALWEYFVHGRGVYRMGIWRLVGIEDTFGDPNTFAAKTVLVLPFLLVLAAREDRRAFRFAWLALFGQAGLVVVLTGSRAGLLSLACCLLLSPLLVPETRRLALVLGLVGGILLFAWIPREIARRYETIVHPELNRAARESVEGRKAGFWKGLWLYRHLPVAGIGPGCFVVSRPHVGPIPGEVPGLQPHNLAGQLLGETGTVGLVGFTALAAAFLASWRSLRRSVRRPRRLPGRPPPVEDRGAVAPIADALAVSFLLMLILGIPGHNLYQYNWAWLAAGMAVACRSAGAACSGSGDRARKRR